MVIQLSSASRRTAGRLGRTETGNAVTIRVQAHVARMEPGLPQELQSVIRISKISPEVADGQIQLATRTHDLFSSDADGATYYAAGHVPRVTEHLRNLGYRVEIIDETLIGTPFDERLLASPALSSEAQELLARVQGQAGGQILVPSPAKDAQAVKLLCLAYPEARSVVATRTKDEAQRIFGVLQEIRNRPVNCSPDLLFSPRQILVCSSSCLRGINDLDWEQVIVVGDKAAAAMSTITELVKLPKQMRFCVRSDRYCLDRTALLLLERAFGSVIYSWHGTSAPSSTVQFLAAPLDSFAPLDNQPNSRRSTGEQTTQWEWERRHLWESDRRNQFIAGLAQAVEQQNIVKLYEYGVQNPEALIAYAEGAVRVLVDHPAAARAVAKYLPHYDVWDGIPSEEELVINGVPHFRPAVATFAGAVTNGLSSGVVIRADGSDAPWQDKWRTTKGQTFAVIDIRDDFDARATGNSQRRCHHYRRMGWTILGRQHHHAG